MNPVGPYPGASQTVGGSTLPASPTPRQVFMKTSGGSEGLYICFSAGTWLLVEANTGAGTVTSVSVTTNAGVSGVVANATTTPAITLTLGAITPTSVNGLTVSTTTGTFTLTNGKTLSVAKTMSLTAADDTGVYTLPTGTKTLLATDGSGTGLSGVTLSAIVPNTAPSAGQVLAGNAGGTAYAPISISGDAALASTGALTLASTVSAGGPTGSATVAPIITYDAKGRLTTVASATITPAVGSITGLGTGVATALAVNVDSAGAFVLNGGALGSPSSAGTLPALTLGGTVTSNGQSFSGTIANLGSVTTVDINGGTLDAVVIGGTGPAAGTFTTVAASGNISTSSGNHLAGNTGGFLSTGGESGIVVRTAGNLDFYNGGAIKMIIATTGAITLTSGITDASGTPGSLCYNTSTFAMLKNNALTCTVSSRLFKKGIRSFKDGALPIINKLRPVRFAYKDHEDRERLGFIAEELAKVDIRLADNFTSSGRAMSIDQNAILGLVVEAIQELFTQNQVLNARLETLHARG